MDPDEIIGGILLKIAHVLGMFLGIHEPLVTGQLLGFRHHR